MPVLARSGRSGQVETLAALPGSFLRGRREKLPACPTPAETFGHGRIGNPRAFATEPSKFIGVRLETSLVLASGVCATSARTSSSARTHRAVENRRSRANAQNLDRLRRQVCADRFTYLCRHKPVVPVADGHAAPSGEPEEQTTETNVSSSLHATVFSPVTTRNALAAAPGSRFHRRFAQQ
jgi:hypothetical protein